MEPVLKENSLAFRSCPCNKEDERQLMCALSSYCWLKEEAHSVSDMKEIEEKATGQRLTVKSETLRTETCETKVNVIVVSYTKEARLHGIRYGSTIKLTAQCIRKPRVKYCKTSSSWQALNENNILPLNYLHAQMMSKIRCCAQLYACMANHTRPTLVHMKWVSI